MSLELWQRHKDLEKRVAEMEKAREASPTDILKEVDDLRTKITELENKYRMLNARVSRKSTELDPS